MSPKLRPGSSIFLGIEFVKRGPLAQRLWASLQLNLYILLLDDKQTIRGNQTTFPRYEWTCYWECGRWMMGAERSTSHNWGAMTMSHEWRLSADRSIDTSQGLPYEWITRDVQPVIIHYTYKFILRLVVKPVIFTQRHQSAVNPYVTKNLISSFYSIENLIRLQWKSPMTRKQGLFPSYARRI